MMHADGMAAAQIGRVEGVTAECIRRFFRANGCEMKRGRPFRTDEDRRLFARYGMYKLELDHINYYFRSSNGKTPLDRFRTQRARAKTRGIRWEFTFADWWGVWARSGKWRKRGNGLGFYVMARYRDQGPYSVENVCILPSDDNTREGMDVHWDAVIAGERPIPGSVKHIADPKEIRRHRIFKRES